MNPKFGTDMVTSPLTNLWHNIIPFQSQVDLILHYCPGTIQPGVYRYNPLFQEPHSTTKAFPKPQKTTHVLTSTGCI